MKEQKRHLEVSDIDKKILTAEKLALPLVISAPHDAEAVGEFAERMLLGAILRGEMSDRWTYEVGNHPQAFAVMCSIVSRILGDLNRDETAADVFRDTDFLGNTIWKPGQELSDNEKLGLIERYHRPYYAQLTAHLQHKHTVAGKESRVLFVDMHDTGDFNHTTGEYDKYVDKEKKKRMPPFIISNNGLAHTGQPDPERGGWTTCPPDMLHELRFLIAYNFGIDVSDVEINTDYRGGNIVRKFGGPEFDAGQDVWAVQIEYHRGYVMDQESREPNIDNIARMNKLFTKIFNDLVRNTTKQS